MTDLSPERTAAVWASLEAAAGRIGDEETRARYLAAWRERYDAHFPRWLHGEDIVRLPDWKHVGEISAVERRRAKLVSDGWLNAAVVDPMEADSCKRFAWELGRRVGAGLIEAGEARASLDGRISTSLDAARDERSVERAFLRGRDGEAGEALLAAIVLDLRCAALARSDLGLAERFRLRHGHDFHHTTAKGWLKWEGKRWRVLDEERGVIPAEILLAVFETVRAIQREAAAVRATGLDEGSIPEVADEFKVKVEDGGVKVPLSELERGGNGLDALVITASTCRLLSETLARFGRASEDAKRIRCIADLARRWLTVRIQDFDTDPLVVNCQNGTLRLRREAEADGSVRVSADLAAHERGDLLTKIAHVAYDPDAACPHYDATIVWAQPKPAMRRYLHQWGGYNLTGDMGAQIFHIWWGPLAQNGKSTILDAWADAAGDYADAGKIETFMEAAQSRGGDAATPALARLPGVRMLRTGEPPAGAKFDESLINQITGQDTLQIRDNFRSFFAARLQIKVTVACNAPPAIPNATEGIKRRVKVVPFEKTMKGALRPDGTPLRDEKFKDKLVPELTGVFARLVEGALDWLKHGFVEPQDVTDWTEEYKDENDPLGRFLAYCVAIDEKAQIQSSRLHALFEAWSKATGGPEWKQAYFTKKMGAKGFSTRRSNGMQFPGLRAVKEVGDFLDHEGKVIDVSGEAGWVKPSPPPSTAPPDLPDSGFWDGPGDDSGAFLD